MEHQVPGIILISFVSIVTCTSHKAHNDTVIRENYGVSFQKNGILDNSHSVWHQTFVIPMATDDIPMPDLYCSALHQTTNPGLQIQELCPTIQAYNDRHFRLLKDIHSSQHNINQLLGDVPLRSKRAPFGFLGRFAKSLFGVSTEQDTNIL